MRTIRDSLFRLMAPGWLIQRGPAPCPACDAPLEPALAGEAAVRCPHCTVPLEPVEVAGFLRRIGAVSVDLAILAATAVPLNLLLIALVSPPALVQATTPMGALLEVLGAPPRALLARIVPGLMMAYLYFVLFWITSGATPGCRVLGLRVVDSHGRRMAPGRAILRATVHVLGLLPGLLGYLWIAFDLEKRGWHDKAAGSYVIRTLGGGSG